jgi:hypothetical protein
MICLNFNIPQVASDYDELVNVFDNKDIAYALLANNNGYNLDYTTEGLESKLFQDLMKLPEIGNNRSKALKTKAVIYSKSFKSWLNSIEEPTIENNMFVNKKGETRPIVFPRTNIFSNTSVLSKFNSPGESPRIIKYNNLQARALNFLSTTTDRDITKVFKEDVVTTENPNWVKDINRLKSMLSTNESFIENGLFNHRGDSYIMNLNANLFESIVDEKKLINNLNTKSREENKTNKIAEHGVLHKHDKANWVVVTDEDYGITWTDLTEPKRKENIYKRNRRRLYNQNQEYYNTIGRNVIQLREVTKKGLNHTIGIVSFDEDAMKEYNDAKYTQYLNSMQQYMEMRNESEASEDLDMSVLEQKLYEEKNQVVKEKSTLESSGGKQSDINNLDNRIESLNDRIDKIHKNGELTDIYNEAERNLIEIEKILNKPKLSPAEFNDSVTKLKMWIKSGDFSEETHMFLDEEMRDSEIIQDKFSDISRRAALLMPKLLNKGKVILSNGVNSTFNTGLTFEQIISLPHKLGAWFKNTLSLNRVGQALAQYVAKIVNEANDSAYREVKIKSRDLAELYKSMKSSGFNESLFFQTTDVEIDDIKHKTPTGRLVHKFSQKYFSDKHDNQNVSFRKNNQFTIDPTKLNDPKYIKEIETNLGVIGTKEYIEKAKTAYENYLKVREDHISVEYGEEELTNEQKADLEVWERNNSPIYRIKAINNAKGGSIYDVVGKDTFLVIVPKRFTKSGVDLGYYDTNFEQIEAIPVAYEFYKKAKEITNTAQKLYGHSDLKSTSLTFIEADMLAKLNKVGVPEFLTKELVNEILGELEGGKPLKEKIDPITGKPIRTIRLGTSTIDGMIKELYNKKKLETQLKLDRELDDTERKQLYIDASNEIFNKMNTDKDSGTLFKSLNLLNLAATTYKHSVMIEDMVNVAMTYLPNSTVNTGDEIIDSKGNTVGQGYIDNLKEMVDYFLKEAYYKQPKGDTSKNLFTVTTKQDKQRQKEIKQLLENPNITKEEQDILNRELDSLGTRVTTNSLVKGLMSFMRLKGMGWNIPAGIANLAIGKITNMYKAAEGRLYNMKEWLQAESMLYTQSKKFNKVTENYNILGDILYEFKQSNKFDEGKNWFFKLTKSIKPYAIQTATEKSNQGTVMIAMMLHAKVTNDKGETKSMWEAINENGTLSDEWVFENKRGADAITAMVTRVKSQIQEIHGDYTNPLMVKDTLAGRMGSMFRLWFFEAFHSRFGVEKMDYNRNITTKGRYRTWVELTKKYKLNPSAIYKAWKTGELSEVDKANMKVNLAELSTLVLSFGLYALMKKGMCGDDKKCKNANIAQLSIMNIMQKINKDIQFYYNPKAWSDLIKNPTSMTSLLDDMWKLYSLSITEMFGEDEDMIYQSGYHKDESKWSPFIESQLPLLNSVERMKRFGDELIQTN